MEIRTLSHETDANHHEFGAANGQKLCCNRSKVLKVKVEVFWNIPRTVASFWSTLCMKILRLSDVRPQLHHHNLVVVFSFCGALWPVLRTETVSFRCELTRIRRRHTTSLQWRSYIHETVQTNFCGFQRSFGGICIRQLMQK